MVEIEGTQIHILSDIFVAVPVVISYTPYCLSGGSYQEMVHCIVLNSKLTHRGLSNNRFKLLRVTPVQIKPKLFRVIVNLWAR